MHPLRLYAQCLRAPSTPRVRFSDGAVTALPVERYLAPADTTDERLLDRVQGPVLDVGCGPGRHLHALAARGVFALGVDLSPLAVELACNGGARAIVASVFDELPGDGTWRTALLLDGNIGIGGAPARLLHRLKGLLHADGEILVEVEPPGTPTTALRARIETATQVSAWFPWARVSTTAIEATARAGGFARIESWCLGDRYFARLASASTRSCTYESFSITPRASVNGYRSS